MAAFPSWTRLFFKTATSPTGWTKDNSDTYDHGLRIVSGYLGTSVTGPDLQNNNSPWSSTMTNTTFPIVAGTISPTNTNPAVQDVPPHSHTGGGTRWVAPAPGYSATTLAYFNTMNTNPTYAAQPFTTSNPDSGATSTGDGVHLHTVTFSQTFSSPTTYNNTNFNVKYTDLILAYKTPTGAKTYNIFLSQNTINITIGSNTLVNVDQFFYINIAAPLSVPLGKVYIYNIIRIMENQYSVSPAESNSFSYESGPLTLTTTTTTRNGSAKFFGSNLSKIISTNEYFKFEIIDPAIGSSIYVSPPIGMIIAPVSMSILNPLTTINEGDTYTFNIRITNATSIDMIIFWNLVLSTSVTSSRFVATSGPLLQKQFDSNTNILTGTATFTIIKDEFTQGTTNTAIEIRQNTNLTGTLLGSSGFSILDTSRTSAYSWSTSNPASIYENVSTSFSINITNVDPGKTFTYNINHISTQSTGYFTTNSDFNATSGTFTNSGTYSASIATFNISTTLNTREQPSKIFKVTIKRNDTNLQVLSQNVTLIDNIAEIRYDKTYTLNDNPGTGTFVAAGGSSFGYSNNPAYTKYLWTVPAEVYSISVIASGSKGGRKTGTNQYGGGGALAYRNYIDVTPGQVLTVVVGALGVDHTATQPNAPISAFGGFSGITDTSGNWFLCYAEGGFPAAGGGVLQSGDGIGGYRITTQITSEKTATLLTAITSTTMTITLTMPSGNPNEIFRWDSSGSVFIDKEWIRYSDRGVNSQNVAYLTVSTGQLGGRGIQTYGNPFDQAAFKWTAAVGHTINTSVRYHTGGYYVGGAGSTGSGGYGDIYSLADVSNQIPFGGVIIVAGGYTRTFPEKDIQKINIAYNWLTYNNTVNENTNDNTYTFSYSYIPPKQFPLTWEIIFGKYVPAVQSTTSPTLGSALSTDFKTLSGVVTTNGMAKYGDGTIKFDTKNISSDVTAPAVMAGRDAGSRQFALIVKNSEGTQIIPNRDTIISAYPTYITLNDNNQEPQGEIQFTYNTASTLADVSNITTTMYQNSDYNSDFGLQVVALVKNYDWTVPSNVYSISVVCIGASGRGSTSTTELAAGGGGLCYRNNIDVYPGLKLRITVGFQATLAASGGFPNIGGPATVSIIDPNNPSIVTPIAIATGGWGGGNGSVTYHGEGGGDIRVQNIGAIPYFTSPVQSFAKFGTLVRLTGNALAQSGGTFVYGCEFTMSRISDFYSWPQTGYIIIDNELIYYSGKSWDGASGNPLVWMSTRGVKIHPRSSGEATHAAGATVKLFDGNFFAGGNGLNSFRPGGAGTFTARGTDGSGLGTQPTPGVTYTDPATNISKWGSYTGTNTTTATGGAIVRIIHGGYYRRFPATNVGALDTPMLLTTFSWTTLPAGLTMNENSTVTFKVTARGFPIGSNLLFFELGPDYSRVTSQAEWWSSSTDFINPNTDNLVIGDSNVAGYIPNTQIAALDPVAVSEGVFTLTSKTGIRDWGPKSFMVYVKRKDSREVVLSTPMTLNNNLPGPTGEIRFDVDTTGYSKTSITQDNAYRYTWTVPANVYSVSVLAVGASGARSTYGGGGGGGGLMYSYNLSVTPGTTNTIQVGRPGTDANASLGAVAGKGGDSLAYVGGDQWLVGAGGGFGGSTVSPYSGGAGGQFTFNGYNPLGYFPTKMNEYTIQLEADLDASTTGTIYFTERWLGGGFTLYANIPKTGTLLIENEFIRYSNAGFVKINNSYVFFITIAQRGLAYAANASGATIHLKNAWVGFLMGEFYAGGKGSAGSATTLGNWGGAAQYASTGTDGSNQLFSDSGSYGSQNRGGLIKIRWSGYSRTFP